MTIEVSSLPQIAEVTGEVSVSARQGQPAKYSGGSGLFRLLLKNTLLNLITLGLYRFWARTAMRRYFWSAITIDDEPLEYTGRGSELFIGFLIVMAVFVPVSIVYYAVQTMLVGNETALSGLDVLYFVALTLLIAAGQYRARRYRLSRTLWRGIRAAQDGSTWAYVWRSAAWTLAFPVSLGLSVPWAATDLARYRIDHTLWGDQRGYFVGRATGLLRPWLVVWLLMVLPFLVLAAVLAPTVITQGVAGSFGDIFQAATAGYSPAWIISIVAIGILPWLLLPIAYIYFIFSWLRWYVSGTRIGVFALSANFSPGRLTARTVLSYLLVFLALLVMIVMIGVAMGMRKFSLQAANPVLIVTVLGSMAAFYVLGGIGATLLITVPLLRRIVDGTSIGGLDAVDSVLQSTQQSDKSGEGLADSFDIGIA